MFVTCSAFGHCGRALLRPVYGRAQATVTDKEVHHLNSALRASLTSLLQFLEDLHQPVAVVYSDAFYTPVAGGGQRNGWGFVTRINDQVFYSHGTVPAMVLNRFCLSKAFMYFLEMTAHLIPLLVLRDSLPNFVVAYMDNQAGLQVLKKGYGKDAVTNAFLAVLTKMFVVLEFSVRYEWVPSDQNISDPISRLRLVALVVYADLGLQGL